ncbi:NACHT, LRR and PYD domains-containing protein 1b allele 5 [Varanus komodoensis]|nr:NACHT, LRR and PYD domains-containing protein 1b allele 5 [Varanus komodoensis]
MTSGLQVQDSESDVSVLEDTGASSMNFRVLYMVQVYLHKHPVRILLITFSLRRLVFSFCFNLETDNQQHCEHCKVQQEQQEQVTPKRLARGQLRLKLDAEGTYQCTATGLIFEVTKAVVIDYSLLSWTKYAAYVKHPWIVVGPIFDVKCASPFVLKSIQFPHTLCLKGHLSGLTFKVFHFKNNGPEFEQPVDHSATHIRWQVSSLSPVGPVIENYNPVYYHGVVMLYKVVNEHPSLKLRVYVASNNSSFLKDVSKIVRHSIDKFIKIDKPPCHKLLQGGKKYKLMSEPEAEITPEEIQFDDDSTIPQKPFFEVFLEQPTELTLSLMDLASEEIVWKAKLRESKFSLEKPQGFLQAGKMGGGGGQRKKKKWGNRSYFFRCHLAHELDATQPHTCSTGSRDFAKAVPEWLDSNKLWGKAHPIACFDTIFFSIDSSGNRRRKSSTSLSEYEHCNKRLKRNSSSDRIKAGTVLTDQQLMMLAKKMGKDWKVIGIQCLKLSIEEIEQIAAKEEDVNMYKCMMLRKWRDSVQNNGTAQSLYECLKCEASHEVLEILKGKYHLFTFSFSMMFPELESPGKLLPHVTFLCYEKWDLCSVVIAAMEFWRYAEDTGVCFSIKALPG